MGRGIARQEARADVAHRELVAMGYDGSEGTTRRVVAAAKESWEAGNRRTYMPWIPEPGSWLQFDFGDGPAVGGRRTWLCCAWLAWSRFRVVVPILDKTVPGRRPDPGQDRRYGHQLSGCECSTSAGPALVMPGQGDGQDGRGGPSTRRPCRRWHRPFAPESPGR